MGLVLLMGGLMLAKWLLLPQPKYSSKPLPAAPRAFVMPDQQAVFAQYSGSAGCRECHPAEFEKWQHSHHGLAERAANAELDANAFGPGKGFEHGSQRTDPLVQDQGYALKALGFQGQIKAFPVVRVIGHDPLRQFLIAGERGALHASEACYDPKRGDWFNVYGQEDRRPGEWGHWTGRGMVWNQMCASCHNTRLRKNYEAASDSYHTAMAETSVGCESCHGPMRSHQDWQRQHRGAKGDPTLMKFSRDAQTETCAGCHARRAELTGDFVPGDSFWDHYDLSITDGSDLFYPDGQIRDEDYEFTSFHSSRMHHSGVRCMDCHDMHSMKTLLPGNQLCMRCHTQGGFPKAPVIAEATHSFHASGSTGAQCVACHMPTTTYMQRHPRHDHSFSVPDPQLTLDWGVPNACNKCHQDKDAAWAATAAKKWWGDRLERRTRSRANIVARARAGRPEARGEILAWLRETADETAPWRASLALLLEAWATDEETQATLQRLLKDEHPLVRRSAIRALESQVENPQIRRAIEPCLMDAARLVRVAAAWALRSSIREDEVAAQDLRHMLELNSDQPSGQMQKGQWHYARGETQQAEDAMKQAIAWDPNSPPFHRDLAMLQASAGKLQEAIGSLQAASKRAPNHAPYLYELALLQNEAGDLAAATQSLQRCVKADAKHARAWYNLGLALHQQGRSAEAIAALRQGESADPNDGAIAYARATILYPMGRRDEALAAVEAALRAQPQLREAQQLRALILSGQ